MVCSKVILLVFVLVHWDCVDKRGYTAEFMNNRSLPFTIAGRTFEMGAEE